MTTKNLKIIKDHFKKNYGILFKKNKNGNKFIYLDEWNDSRIYIVIELIDDNIIIHFEWFIEEEKESIGDYYSFDIYKDYCIEDVLDELERIDKYIIDWKIDSPKLKSNRRRIKIDLIKI